MVRCNYLYEVVAVRNARVRIYFEEGGPYHGSIK